MNPQDTSVAILGTGPAGKALAKALQEKGFFLSAIYNRKAEKAAHTAKALSKDTPIPTFSDASEAAKTGDIVIFAVPDRALSELAGEIASAGGFKKGGLAVHLSGALPSSVLEPANLLGARVGSLHPMKSFADDVKGNNFKGVCFGIEGEESAIADLEAIVLALEGQPLKVRTEDKALYHAASAVVSNFTVSIFHLGLEVLDAIGIDRKTGTSALTALLQGTTENISEVGVPKALTGPIARGDSETVAAHMEALKKHSKDRLPLYAALARYTVEVGLAKGSLSVEGAEVLRSMLARYI